MAPKFFKDRTAFRNWLDKNHEKKTELLVGFYKVGSGKPSITWPESVEEALCFGWIDGIRKSIDKNSYSIRFTPRRATSNWSAVNIRKVKELKKLGLMLPAGIEVFEKRKKERSADYSYESGSKIFNENYEKIFRDNEKAWAFFAAQAPSYKKTIINWIMTAKQEKTKIIRLEKVIAASGKQKKLY